MNHESPYTEMKIIFQEMVQDNFADNFLDEVCHWLKLIYLFLRHVVYITAYSNSEFI
jgi:hypothetical protein